MSKIKKIGILTSGGDCAGLNFAIGSVVKTAVLEYGCQVYGIYNSTVGLMQRPVSSIELTPDMFCVEKMCKGGTFLGTVNKGHPFNYPMPDGTFKDRSSEIIEGYKQLGLDALVAIGGDGSMRIIEKLTSMGDIKFVGIPKTVDNDVAFTDYAIGFMTAVDTASACIRNLHDTALSHQRVLVVETMGREVGHLALHSGISGLADVILLPEIPYDINVVAQRVKEVWQKKKYVMVVCSEAIYEKGGEQSTITIDSATKKFQGAGDKLAKDLEELTGIESRVAVLGHIQRGGSPVPFDRLLAASLASRAIELLFEGKNRRLVGIQSDKIIDAPLEDVASTQKAVDPENDYLVKTARSLGICFGN